MQIIQRALRAFTLIELMIVIAIIGILMAIALPQYQQYIIRAKITEGFHLAAVAKLAVAEYYQTNGQWPTSNTEAGILSTVSSKYVTSVVIAPNGVITVSFRSSVGTGDNSTVMLTPEANNGVINWLCSGTLASEYRPSSCR